GRTQEPAERAGDGADRVGGEGQQRGGEQLERWKNICGNTNEYGGRAVTEEDAPFQRGTDQAAKRPAPIRGPDGPEGQCGGTRQGSRPASDRFGWVPALQHLRIVGQSSRMRVVRSPPRTCAALRPAVGLEVEAGGHERIDGLLNEGIGSPSPTRRVLN